jgi:thermosome
MSEQSYIPVIILKEGSSEREEDEVRSFILGASEVINEAVSSMLGPNGKFKLIMDTFGDVTITSSGATALEEVEVEHPAAKVLVDTAKAVNKDVGDGVTSTIILATELVNKANELIQKGIHPSIICEGYEKAFKYAQEALERNAFKINYNERKNLLSVAKTAITSFTSIEDAEYLAELAVEAVTRVLEEGKLDTDRIKIDKKSGGTLRDTIFIEGVALDKEIVHAAMPKLIKNPKIALLDTSLEVRKTEYDEKLKFKDPTMLRSFIRKEQDTMREMVDKIKATGANVVLCQKGIDDFVQYLLSKEGIAAVRRIKKSDMEKLEIATGGKIVTNLDELSQEFLGNAELFEERKLGDEKWVFIISGKKSKSVNIIVRGDNDKIVSEAERSIKKAIKALEAVFEDPRVVSGAGAIEIELARELRDRSTREEGRVQYAIEAFADALERIPANIARNSGKDPEEVLSTLRSEHTKGRTEYGVGALSEELVVNAKELGILDPLKIKKRVLSAATETAVSLLRIDRITAAAKFKPSEGKKEGQEY